MKDFFNITCLLGGDDDEMFVKVVNQGIDGYLQAFTESKFSVQGNRRVLDFHVSELPILLRRLRELEESEADMWADDIEAVQRGDAS
jgi:hypothetical protein